MAKKEIQPTKDVEVIEPDAPKKASKKENQSKENKVDTKTKAKSKPKKEKKSFKKKVAEIWSELKKVSKPTFGKVVKNTCVVIAVVAICTLLLFGVDRLFSLVYNLLLP